MALKDSWVDKVDGVDYNRATDINEVAHAVIVIEKFIENIDTTPNNVSGVLDLCEEVKKQTPDFVFPTPEVLSDKKKFLHWLDIEWGNASFNPNDLGFGENNISYIKFKSNQDGIEKICSIVFRKVEPYEYDTSKRIYSIEILYNLDFYIEFSQICKKNEVSGEWEADGICLWYHSENFNYDQANEMHTELIDNMKAYVDQAIGQALGGDY